MSGFPPHPSPILMAETSIKSGEVNLARLLKHTEFHPKGRVEIDENGEVKNPKNPKKGKVKTTVVEDGVARKIEIDRFQGHVTGEGSVWRIAMTKNGKTGPETYFDMSKEYAKRLALGRSKDDFRPELELVELEDYVKWLKKNGKEHPVEGELPEQEEAKK